LCLFGFHLRSKGLARDTDSGLVSVCARCGKPMTRDRSGKWGVTKA